MRMITSLLILCLSMIGHTQGAVDPVSKVDSEESYCKVPYVDKKDGSAGVYRGQCAGGKPHGSGRVSYHNGDTIVGTFKNGVLDGAGTYTSSNGNVYEGTWMDGKRHGNGTFIWARGSRYVGEWTMDKKHGNGVYTWANGNRFEGEFRNDKRYNGKYYTSNGRVYKCRLGQCK